MTSLPEDLVAQRRAALRTVAEAYFDGLKRKDLSAVPWHDDVALRTPLAPGGANTPILGLASVRAFFDMIAPMVANVTVAELYFTEDGTGIAARADIEIVQPPCTLRVLDRFDVDADNRIVGQENHFDPRPALDDRQQ